MMNSGVVGLRRSFRNTFEPGGSASLRLAVWDRMYADSRSRSRSFSVVPTYDCRPNDVDDALVVAVRFETNCCERLGNGTCSPAKLRARVAVVLYGDRGWSNLERTDATIPALGFREVPKPLRENPRPKLSRASSSDSMESPSILGVLSLGEGTYSALPGVSERNAGVGERKRDAIGRLSSDSCGESTRW